MKNQILFGDCQEVLKSLQDNSVDSVVTDPPDGLGTHEPTLGEIHFFLMGKHLNTGGDFMGNDWEIPTIPVWQEIFRVLKPGGHVLCFAGTRSWDLMSLGLRAAGFENRDTIAHDHPALRWVYSQGFPKSLDISKALDKAAGAKREVVGHRNDGRYKYGFSEQAKKGLGGVAHEYSKGWVGDPTNITNPTTPEAKEWQGWGTALKPSWEPILVFRKPLEGTVVNNVLKHSTGGLNVDGCKVRGKEIITRWPPNTIQSHHPDCGHTCSPLCPIKELDEQSGNLKSGAMAPTVRKNRTGFSGPMPEKTNATIGDYGPPSKFFPSFEGQEPVNPPFQYVPKPSKRETSLNGEITNNHPTKKPLKLMQWLVRLVTPPGGTVLDPYCGSGTTLHAAREEGLTYIGIEKYENAYNITKARMKVVEEQMAEKEYQHDAFNLAMSLEDDP